MLKQLTQKPLLIALLAASAGFASNAFAAEDIKVDPKIQAHVPYVIDSRGVVVRNATPFIVSLLIVTFGRRRQTLRRSVIECRGPTCWCLQRYSTT